MESAQVNPDKMKALLKSKAQQSYEYVDVDVPIPKENELLVRMEMVAICGSDIPLYKWDATGQKIASIPFIPGHECVGEIFKLGPGVTEFSVGDRVCSETHLPCHKCYQCTHDLQHICQEMGLFGHGKKTIYGGCAQYAIMRTDAVYKLKTRMNADLAVLLEPFGVSHHAIEEVDLQAADILITGAGPIGLYCIAIAKALGSKKIMCIDIAEIRLQKARELGAHVAINTSGKDVAWIKQRILEVTEGNGASCLIECTGAPPIVNAMFSFIRKGGRMVLVGVPKAPLHVEDVINDLHWKSFSLKSIHGRKMFHTWEQSEQLLASGQVNIDGTVSHVFPMSQFEKAFEVLFAGEGCKILIDPQH